MNKSFYLFRELDGGLVLEAEIGYAKDEYAGFDTFFPHAHAPYVAAVEFDSPQAEHEAIVALGGTDFAKFMDEVDEDTIRAEGEEAALERAISTQETRRYFAAR